MRSASSPLAAAFAVASPAATLRAPLAAAPGCWSSSQVLGARVAAERTRRPRRRASFVAAAPAPTFYASVEDQASAAAGEEEEGGVVNKLFSVFFGKPQAAPSGLKRFDRDRFPEQFPATLDEFAVPVDGDNEQVALFRPLLARTQLEKRRLRCAYDANVDGWSYEEFHRNCNHLGAGVVLARTKGGAVCGGYNPKGWVGYGESRGSIAAFLFTWPDGDTSKPAIKLRKVGGASMATHDLSDSGPRFGAGDGFVVPLKGGGGRERVARSKLGPFYEVRPDGKKTLFADEEGKEATLEELRVFVGVYAEGEFIPFDDALPLALE
eukprot:tig00020830_g14406.t1